jgi:mannose-1-phosphate guanylyltransferase
MVDGSSEEGGTAMRQLPPRFATSRAHGPRELHALVLAGGAGRRLEAMTQRLFGASVPKQYCRFGSDRSLIEQTIERIAPIVPNRRVSVVVDRSQIERANAQLCGYAGLQMVPQPCDRGTAAGVLLPLLSVLQRAPDATIVLLASDHGVARPELLRATIVAASIIVRKRPECIVLIGAEAEAPNTDYGWIVRPQRPQAGSVPDRVARFVEKPDSEEAEYLFATRRGLWNTMLLVARGMSLLRLFERLLPELTKSLARLVAHGGAAIALKDYSALAEASFSRDVLERAHSLSVLSLPLATGWTNLGTEARVAAWMKWQASHSLAHPARAFAFDFGTVKRLLGRKRRDLPRAATGAGLSDATPGVLVRACAWHEDVRGPNVTHTICPACFERVAAEIAATPRRLAPARSMVR